MARPWRIQYEGAVYHVMSRGVARGDIFSIEEDYCRFLKYLEMAVEKFRLEIFAFVLMRNHYHLFLRTKEVNLSKAMQWLQTCYSIYYNIRHNRSGHVFQGRYKSILVGDESYWQSLSLYIHLNPIRAKVVEDLNKYRWSSYSDYIGKKAHKWVLCEEILKEFGKNRDMARRSYRELIMEVCGKEKKFLGEVKYGLILGNEGFINWVQNRFIDKDSRWDEELPQKRMVSNNGIIDRVLDEVGNVFGVDRDKILKRNRRVQEIGRDAGMYILKMYTGLDNKKIGEVFGVSLSAVTKASGRLREEMAVDSRLKNRVNRIVNSIFKV